jgi:hypothetical protein
MVQGHWAMKKNFYLFIYFVWGLGGGGDKLDMQKKNYLLIYNMVLG